ncbi:MAG: RNA-binding protein [Christensenellaceae bacterium]
METTFAVGDVVVSISGRDEGRVYLVVKTEENFIWGSDGNFRRLANPKKKKWKHIKPLSASSPSIGEKLKSGKQVFDSEIYSALRAIRVQDSKMKAEE